MPLLRLITSLSAFPRKWLPWQIYPTVGCATQSPLRMRYGDSLVSPVSDLTTIPPCTIRHTPHSALNCLHNRFQFGSPSATLSLEIWSSLPASLVQQCHPLDTTYATFWRQQSFSFAWRLPSTPNNSTWITQSTSKPIYKIELFIF